MNILTDLNGKRKMTDSIDLKRIANAHLALSNVKGEWGENYWTTVLAALLRKANRLN